MKVSPAAGRHIRIGVHGAGEPERVADTLRALYEHTPDPFELVVLDDPPPGAEGARETAVPLVRRCAVPSPGGAPAAFNQLVAAPADIYLFLEAGARPAPGWLALLVAALDADPANGLAGPSTNLCWNEQAVAPHCDGTPAALRRQAKALLDRARGPSRSMAPLYSLADFCLAVRKEAVAAVGAADTAYGRGPCWEMDYAARAARAGFDSVWAEAAFVHRAALAAARLSAERDLLATNKRLYQDRLCGRRHGPGAAGAPYHAHCRGALCADFAPPATTRIHLSLPPAEAETAVPAAEPPLVSCIMPTQRRPGYVAQAIAYFRRQDYPARELVIACRGDDDLPGPIDDPDIRVVHTGEASIGGMRNAAVRAARGGIIVHWDDDDWHGPRRLSRQAAPIVQGLADITGLNDTLFLALASRAFWVASPDLYARLFVENVAGGSMMFRREIWERSGPYPPISLREDAELLERAVRDGARLCRLPGRDDYVYVRHTGNTWRFEEGRYLEPDAWTTTAEPASLAPDRAFYFGPAAMPARAPATAKDAELVSCIMPTRNRRAFVERAIAQFLRQDYGQRELIVVDDGDDRIADLIPAVPSIRYRRLEGSFSIGEKRNMACEMARGPIIAHWDDDDWMAPQWLSSQVETLAGNQADVCGLDRVFFYDPGRRSAWRYVYDDPRPWVCGGTLCYTKAFWRRGPFPEINLGEDNAFVWSALDKRIAVNPRNELYVGIIHPDNTSPKIASHRRWHSIQSALVEALMREEA